MMGISTRGHLSAFLLMFLIAACQLTETSLHEPEVIEDIDPEQAVLKAHMPDGGMYIFEEQWSIETTGENGDTTIVSGEAEKYDEERELIEESQVELDVGDVALFETNKVVSNPAVAAKTIITVASLGVTAYCAANPKACFGSCPTFYVPEEDTTRLRAEGFSHSFLPSLESRDVDMLYHFQPHDRELDITMKNEALETHVVRHVDLLAVPSPENGRIFKDQENRFWEVSHRTPPVECQSPGKECLAKLQEYDDREWYGSAGRESLDEQEEIVLSFEPDFDANAILIAGRHTLLTTYLFYQSLSYLGEDAGQWLARLESGDNLMQHTEVTRLAGLKVQIKTEDGWEEVDSITEYGPLAADIHLVHLPEINSDDAVQIKLQAAKGVWRLNHAALARTGQKREPETIPPHRAEPVAGGFDDALLSLLDPEKHLVTLPGEDYTLSYRLPEAYEEYDYFLDNKGYYIEWMRREWTEETEPEKFIELILDSSTVFERLARDFGEVEDEMEDIFWNSRYERRD